MRKRVITPLALAFLFGALLPPTVGAQDDQGAPGDIVVTLEPGVSIDAINRRYGTETHGSMHGTNIYRVRSGQVTSTIDRMHGDPQVAKAGRDGAVHRHQTVGFPHDGPSLVDPGED